MQQHIDLTRTPEAMRRRSDKKTNGKYTTRAKQAAASHEGEKASEKGYASRADSNRLTFSTFGDWT
jgi:hypothetical protein